ncbi:unnamed protein product [Gordionus sp. m RMFG-2023]
MWRGSAWSAVIQKHNIGLYEHRKSKRQRPVAMNRSSIRIINRSTKHNISKPRCRHKKSSNRKDEHLETILLNSQSAATSESEWNLAILKQIYKSYCYKRINDFRYLFYKKHYDLLTSRGNLADSKTRVKSSPEFSSQRYSQGIKNYPSPPNSILQQPLADILKNQSGEISFSSTKHIPLNNRSPVTFLSDTNSELLISDSIQNGGSKEYINISNGPIEGDSSANIYSTEDDEKLGPEEGEGDTISCLCSEHPGKLYLDLIINNKSCDEVFQLLFTNSHFFRNIQKERNTKSLVMSEWGSSNENMTSNKLSTSQHHNHNLNHHHEKYSKHHIDSHASKKKRVLSYVVEISSPLGTKSAPTTEKQVPFFVCFERIIDYNFWEPTNSRRVSLAI